MMAKKKVKRRPSLLLFLTEGGRAAIDYGSYLATKPLLSKNKKGDGQPVLVLPGFLTTDKSTQILRSFLKELGYVPYTWDLGRNLGDYRYVLESANRVKEIYKKHKTKVNIIGWSLGGVYAREIARAHPKLVRQVITLGSPFGGLKKANNVSWLYKLISGKSVEDLDPELLANMHIAPPVPTTAIYSKTDGVVWWKYCIEEEENSKVQNVEVNCAHLAYGYSPAVFLCIADRLAQSTRNWKPYVNISISDIWKEALEMELDLQLTT